MNMIEGIKERLQKEIELEHMKELPIGSENILLYDIQYLLSKLEIAEKALAHIHEDTEDEVTQVFARVALQQLRV